MGWSKLQSGFIEINFDGSKSSTVMGARFVIRGWRENFIATCYRFIEEASTIVTEATTMQDGVKEAIDMGFKYIIVEEDNKRVIQSIRGEVNVP